MAYLNMLSDLGMNYTLNRSCSTHARHSPPREVWAGSQLAST
jgi:hypothetical protein